MKVSLGHHAQHRLVFAGAFGVGKTTALQAISDIPVANTEVRSLEVDAALQVAGKTTTTVGLDYGELRLADYGVVSLYGLPGQQRFNEMWRVLLVEQAGVILWVYGDRAEALDECRSWLDILRDHDATAQLAVAVTRLPQPTPTEVLAPFRALVSQYNPYAPVISADPRNRHQVIQAVLMAVVTPGLKSE